MPAMRTRKVFQVFKDLSKWQLLMSVVFSLVILFGIERLGLLKRSAEPGDRFQSDLRSRDAAIRAESIRRQFLGRARFGEAQSAEQNDEQLIAMLSDENSDVRLLAAEALGHEGGGADRRVQALLPMLNDGHAGIRRAVALSLGDNRLDQPLLAALDDENAQVRAGALWALLYTQGDKEPGHPLKRLKDSLPAFTKLAANDPDPDVRKAAERLLQDMGSDR
jgi:HEAT repeat protein